jgi:hypothetical protein
MKPYSSIEGVYVRENRSKTVTVGAIRNDVNTTIKNWYITEKVDGTNIRAIYGPDGLEIRGRTDKAQFSNHQLEGFRAHLPTWEEVNTAFTLIDDEENATGRIITFYGEGYGPGIQKNGGRYRDDVSFILFDVRFTNTDHGTDYFLSIENAFGIADELGIEHVPVLCVLDQSVLANVDEEMLRSMIPHSVVAKKFKGHEVEAEGIVAKPQYELSDQYGNRIAWKICFRDF